VSEDEEMKTHRHRRHGTEVKLRIVQSYQPTAAAHLSGLDTEKTHYAIQNKLVD
jgi:hypothetical protein